MDTVEEKYSIENFEKVLLNVERLERNLQKVKKKNSQLEKALEGMREKYNYSIQTKEDGERKSIVGKFKKKGTLKEF
jgi:hypothetical protein